MLIKSLLLFIGVVSLSACVSSAGKNTNVPVTEKKAESNFNYQKFKDENELYAELDVSVEDRKVVLLPVERITYLDDDSVGAWITEINKNKKYKYDTRQIYVKVNCDLNKITSLQDITTLKSKTVNNFTFNDNWRNIVPYSIGDKIKQVVCKTPAELREWMEGNTFFLSRNSKELVKVSQDVISKTSAKYDK